MPSVICRNPPQRCPAPTLTRLPRADLDPPSMIDDIPALLVKKWAINKIDEIKRRDQRSPGWRQPGSIYACVTSFMCPSIFNVSESTVQNWYENERDEILDDYSLLADPRG